MMMETIRTDRVAVPAPFYDRACATQTLAEYVDVLAGIGADLAREMRKTVQEIGAAAADFDNWRQIETVLNLIAVQAGIVAEFGRDAEEQLVAIAA